MRKQEKNTYQLRLLTRFLRQKTKSLTLYFYMIIIAWILGAFCLFAIMKSNNTLHGKKTVEPYNDIGSGDESFPLQFEPLERTFISTWKKQTAEELRDKQEVMDFIKSILIKPHPTVAPLNYHEIIKGNDDAIEQATLLALEFRGKDFLKKRRELGSVKTPFNNPRSCWEFKRRRKYITRPMTIEEKLYPLAYVIIVHKKLALFERLLRSIYHPQNVYCIHVDNKSSSEFMEGVRNISQCFHNVFIASKLAIVQYTHWSRVEADLNCLRDLIKKKSEVPWKYVINLSGQELPLKTNLEIVRALKSFHGFNHLETQAPLPHKTKRYTFHYELPPTTSYEYSVMKRTNLTKQSPPTNMFVGSAYYLWKRQAVEFILKDSSVKAFFNWSKDTYSPDEHVWATLQRWYARTPGSVPEHSKYDMNEFQSITKLVKWEGVPFSLYDKCSGMYRRGVCVYGAGDIPWLISQRHLFANKFDYNVDPFAIDSLDIWLRNRTISLTFQ